MVNIIKYKSIWSILLGATLLFGACERGLDLKPQSEISQEVFYKTEGEINYALISVYNSLQGLMEFEWLLTEFRSDNTYMNVGSSETKDLPMRELDRFVQNSQNIHVEDYWRAAYRTIALANSVLDHVDILEDETARAKFKAEAKFMRAFAYFRLVRLFGGVFIVEKRITGIEAKGYSRSSEAKVYEMIISDLQYAQEFLPETVSADETGRVTKFVAKGILAKALLTRKQGTDVADADALLDDIISSTHYDLLTSYSDVFSITNEYNKEILFAVRYKSGSVGLGSPFTNYFAPQGSDSYVVNGNGDGYNYPTPSIMASYSAEDVRKDVCVKDSYVGKNKAVVLIDYIAKYLSSVATAEDAENDWIILRYADVLLLKAEATNQLSGPSLALPYLNDIRTRAGLSTYTESDELVSTKYAFSLALEEERRLEFAFENQRWFDLLRTNRTIPVMNQHFRTEFQYNDPTRPFFSVSPLEEWQLILPIPQFEIDLNPSITQNYGY